LKKIVDKLNANEFGYIAQKEGAQFLAYLMVNQARDSLLKGPFPVKIVLLEEDELGLLAGAHAQIVLMNEKCLASVIAQLPSISKAVNPYNKYVFHVPEKILPVSILNLEDINTIAASFGKHPAIAQILDNKLPNVTPVSEDQYIKSVLTFEEMLLRNGLFHNPEDLAKIMHTESPDSPRRIIARHFVGLVCLRASLSILDQLIFQAVLSNKLAYFSQDNVIQVQKATDHLASRALSLVYQLGDQTGIVRCLDLVLAKITQLKMSSAELWRVESVQHQFSQEFGEQTTIDLRNVDDNLNPFGPLLKFM
jgi:hypothetical protein